MEDFFSVKLDRLIPEFIWARKCTRIGKEGQGFGRWEGPVRGKGVRLNTQTYLKVKIVFNMCRHIGHLNKIESPETDEYIERCLECDIFTISNKLN